MISITFRDKESSLGQIILRGNTLHGCVVQPISKWAYGSGIAAEDAIRKCIERVAGQFHGEICTV
jgi:hypothetical protein